MAGPRARARQDVLHFAEFVVVMMLFVVGLEVGPSLLRRVRAPIQLSGQVWDTESLRRDLGGAAERVLE